MEIFSHCSYTVHYSFRLCPILLHLKLFLSGTRAYSQKQLASNIRVVVVIRVLLLPERKGYPPRAVLDTVHYQDTKFSTQKEFIILQRQVVEVRLQRL